MPGYMRRGGGNPAVFSPRATSVSQCGGNRSLGECPNCPGSPCARVLPGKFRKRNATQKADLKVARSACVRAARGFLIGVKFSQATPHHLLGAGAGLPWLGANRATTLSALRRIPSEIREERAKTAAGFAPSDCPSAYRSESGKMKSGGARRSSFLCAAPCGIHRIGDVPAIRRNASAPRRSARGDGLHSVKRANEKRGESRGW